MLPLVLTAVAVGIAIAFFFFTQRSSETKKTETPKNDSKKSDKKKSEVQSTTTKATEKVKASKTPKVEEKKPAPAKPEPKAEEKKPAAAPAKKTTKKEQTKAAPAPVKEEPTKKVKKAKEEPKAAPAPKPVEETVAAAPAKQESKKKAKKAAEPAPAKVETKKEEPKKESKKAAAPAPTPAPATKKDAPKTAAKKAETAKPAAEAKKTTEAAKPAAADKKKKTAEPKAEKKPVDPLEADLRKGFTLVQERKKPTRRPPAAGLLLPTHEEQKQRPNKPFFKKFEKKSEDEVLPPVMPSAVEGEVAVADIEKPRRKKRDTVVQNPYADDAEFWSSSAAKKAITFSTEEQSDEPLAEVKPEAPKRAPKERGPRRERVAKKAEAEAEEGGTVRQLTKIKVSSEPFWKTTSPVAVVALGAEDEFPALGAKPKSKPKPKPVVSVASDEDHESEQDEDNEDAIASVSGAADADDLKRHHAQFDYEHELAAPSDKKQRLVDNIEESAEELSQQSGAIRLSLNVTLEGDNLNADWCMRVCDSLSGFDRSKAISMTSHKNGVWSAELPVSVANDCVRYQYLWTNPNNTTDCVASDIFDLDLEHDSHITNDTFTVVQ